MDKTLQRIMREICTEGEETDVTNSKWGVMKTENCEVSSPARQTNVHKSKYFIPKVRTKLLKTLLFCMVFYISSEWFFFFFFFFSFFFFFF